MDVVLVPEQHEVVNGFEPVDEHGDSPVFERYVLEHGRSLRYRRVNRRAEPVEHGVR